MSTTPAGLDSTDRRRAESLPAAATLVGLTAIAPLAIDMFLPSMPTIADDFAAEGSTIQLAVTLFIVVFAGSQLVYGPASDRFGRRPVLYGGLALFVLGGIVSLFATSAAMLIAGRIIQGAGGGAGPAVARAIVLDVYGRTRAARVLAYMTIATALAPTLAPIAGGVLHELAGWRSVFVTLAAIGLALLVLYRALVPETHLSRDATALQPRRMAGNYRQLLASRVFVSYLLVLGCMFAGYLVFISSSSFVLIDELGLPSWLYGVSFGCAAIGIMGGATLSGRLASRWPAIRVALTGSGLAAAAGLTMTLLARGGVESVFAVVPPMFLVAFGMGMVSPRAMAEALIPFPLMAGLASAVLGFSQMLIASLYNIGFSAITEVDLVAMTTGIAIAEVGGFVALSLLRPRAAEEIPTVAPATAEG